MSKVSRSGLSSRPGLAGATFGFVLATMAIVAVVAGLLLWSRSDRLIDGALDEAVRLRTAAAGKILARSLHEDLGNLRSLAARINGASDAEVRAMIEGLHGDKSRMSWIGYATTDGIVHAASDGLLEGVDVSERPWFRNGLSRPDGFAGDVHDAVLLAKKLRPEGGDPLRFVDLAVPVRNGDGEVQGVLGLHINAEWVARSLEEIGDMLAIDLFLINQRGDVIMAPQGIASTEQEISLLRAARAGTQSSSREVWPDGKDYFSSLVPSVSYADLPSFGWRLAGRISADTFHPGLSALVSVGFVTSTTSAIIVLLLTALFVRIAIVPITGLARAADRLAQGADDYPPENHGTREAQTLSSALAKLQGRRL